MSSLHDLAEILARAASLLALATAPPLFSPAPPPPANLLLEAAIAAVAIAAVVAAALRLRARFASREALAAAALLVAAVAAAILGADMFRGPRAPLGRGLLGVAIPLWAGLAIIAGAVARRRLGKSARHARSIATALVGCVAIALLGSQWGWILAPDQMWWQAIRKNGDNGVAADAIVQAPLRARDYHAALGVLDRCLVASPGSCACLARRARVQMRAGAADNALEDARAAVRSCPNDPDARTALAAALTFRGDAIEAEHEAKDALGQRDDARYHYALALAYDGQGRLPEAIDEARRAVDGGAGRDATLLLGFLAIKTGDLDLAQRTLAPLVAADPGDAEAQYDLALVADKKGEYNKARQGYLAALHADPTMTDARYNLAVLTLRRGVVDEARHHAQKLAEASPADPRNADLARRIAAAQQRKP